MKKTTIPIKGMHCRSCELLIEGELAGIPVVNKALVRHKKACAEIYYSGKLNYSQVESAVKKAGYSIGINEKKPFISANIDDYLDIIYALFALGALYVVLKILNLDKALSGSTSDTSSLITIFIIGLTAGISTCMALIGGLVLSVSSRFAQNNPSASPYQKFRPHMSFNLGRIISYFALGGILGVLGSVFQVSTSVVGFMTVGVGLIMVILGLQLTGLFPRLADLSFTLPSSIGKKLGITTSRNSEYSDLSSGLLGAMTFFLPCGFTQTMQLLAISSGDFTRGALIMGVFALGTVPGLLGIGGITSYLQGAMAQKFYKFAGVLVLVFAWMNISNGANLAGIQFSGIESSSASSYNDQLSVGNGEAQILKATFTNAGGMTPKSFTAKAGQPIRLMVTAKENGYGCMSTVMVPKLYNNPLFLEANKTLELDFTAPEPGNYKITCAMGIPHGTLKVI